MPKPIRQKIERGPSLCIGIDPGKAGGVAWHDGLLRTSGCFAMPGTDRDLWDALRAVVVVPVCHVAGQHHVEPSCFACIEQLGAIPGRWDARERCFKLRTSPSSFGKLMLNYGKLLAMLTALGVPYVQVLPRKWQGEFGLLRKNKRESNTDKKNRHKAMAQQLFPQVRVTHGVADALLIAEYCCRYYGK